MSDKKYFNRLGFDADQSRDLGILMSLDTKEQIQEWLTAVGSDDFEYAMDLLEIAAELTLIEDIDAIVETDSSFIDAKIALSGF